MADQVTAADIDPAADEPLSDHERRRLRRRRWWLLTATALGLLLCVQPLFSSGDDSGSAPSAWPSDAVPDGHWSMGTADPLRPSAAAAPEPTSAAPTRPAPASPVNVSPVSGPALLGPSGKAGVQDLAQEYCTRHVNGGLAGPRADGRWQCTRLLLFVRLVDMDTACADTYGQGAYARTEDPDDAYAWRCYRR